MINLDKMAAPQLIAQFVIACRAQGHFLPYDDYEIIDRWLELEPDPDNLLLLLSDVLPTFFAKFRTQQRQAPSLKRVHGRVVKKIQAVKSRHHASDAELTKIIL